MGARGGSRGLGPGLVNQWLRVRAHKCSVTRFSASGWRSVSLRLAATLAKFESYSVVIDPSVVHTSFAAVRRRDKDAYCAFGFEQMTGGSMTGDQDITDFSVVDQTEDPKFFQRFLDRGNSLPSIQQSKSIMLAALDLQPGQRALDLGCGLGDDVFAMAERVGANGQVIGIDISEAMIGDARRRTPMGAPVEFHVGDAQKLEFSTGYFDAVRAERVLMHVPEAAAALSEMVRVTRASGRLCVFDFDWDSFAIDSAAKEVTRAVVLSFSDRFKNGWIGRQLPRMFRQCGIRNLRTETASIFLDFDFLGLLLGGYFRRAVAEGHLEPASLGEWWSGLARANQEGNFLASILAFIISGQV